MTSGFDLGTVSFAINFVVFWWCLWTVRDRWCNQSFTCFNYGWCFSYCCSQFFWHTILLSSWWEYVVQNMIFPFACTAGWWYGWTTVQKVMGPFSVLCFITTCTHMLVAAGKDNWLGKLEFWIELWLQIYAILGWLTHSFQKVICQLLNICTYPLFTLVLLLWHVVSVNFFPFAVSLWFVKGWDKAKIFSLWIKAFIFFFMIYSFSCWFFMGWNKSEFLSLQIFAWIHPLRIFLCLSWPSTNECWFSFALNIWQGFICLSIFKLVHTIWNVESRIVLQSFWFWESILSLSFYPSSKKKLTFHGIFW